MRAPVFELGGIGLALPMRLLHRVEVVDQVAAVPGAPDGLVGIAEVGGRIVTLLDPAHWCETPDGPVPIPEETRYVVTLAEPFANLGLLLGHEPRLERCASTTSVTLDESKLAEFVRSRPREWR